MQSWSSNLAMLSANAAPGSEALITQLGDQLHATSGQASALMSAWHTPQKRTLASLLPCQVLITSRTCVTRNQQH